MHTRQSAETTDGVPVSVVVVEREPGGGVAGAGAAESVGPPLPQRGFGPRLPGGASEWPPKTS
eukprot:9226043-Alexandrium_andersonii.AAC.1